MKQLRPICLASASPRRRELLEQLGLELEVYAVDVDESMAPGETAAEMVSRLAALKAEMALHRFGDHLIVAGDTAVEVDGTVLGKPRDAEEAMEMIGRLAGRSHRVFSAYALLDGVSGTVCPGLGQTTVTFRPLSREWIRWYGHHPETTDKAGGYAIQGAGSAMVEKIEGSYANVVGFPIEVAFWDMVANGWISI